MGSIEKDKAFVHPYMPNSVPAVKQQMLDELGVESIEEIYKSLIPDDLLYKERLNLPEPIVNEYELKRHVMGILKKNITTEDYVSFLGAGCYRHQVPAICDELNMRGEFLTAYCGDTYSDHGKMQAIFEYTSMMGELLDADIVSYTTYDAGQAVSSAFRIVLRVQAARGNARRAVLVPSTMNPEIKSQAYAYCRNAGEIVTVASDVKTGLMDLGDLEEKLRDGSAAAVFYENPSYLGFFETQAEEIARLAHSYGALCIAQPETASLGIVESPMNLGADLVCGDIQPLGMHMQFGGDPARAPLDTRVAFPPATLTSRPPRVYCPSGIPVARMLSLIRIIRSAPSILKAARTTDGWMWIPSQIISAFTWALSDTAPTTPGFLWVNAGIALYRCTAWSAPAAKAAIAVS